jgi:anthranilate phosphoribosyltransferase
METGPPQVNLVQGIYSKHSGLQSLWTAQRSLNALKSWGIGFCFAPIFHPAMRYAAPARKELGVPTVFNILGPLANPAKPQAAAIGVADQRMHRVMAEVLATRGVDGFVFRGDDGLDEITLSTTTSVLTIGSGKFKAIA